MQLGGVFEPDRYVIACTTVPLMEHWFVLLAYANPNLYIATELILEVCHGTGHHGLGRLVLFGGRHD